MSTITETTITEQIREGEHDETLDQIMLAVHKRRQRLKALEDSPVVTRFVEDVRKNPGLTAQELAMLTGVSISRVYQLADLSKQHLKPGEDWPRRFYAKND